MFVYALVLALMAFSGRQTEPQQSAESTPAPSTAPEAPAEYLGISLAPFLPTPDTIVTRMLELAHLKAAEKLCDIGSGDGRIVIAAAREYHADATGVELDDKLARESEEKIRKLGLSQTARIIHGDMLKQRYSQYDVITVYLLPETNDLIQPILERELKKGARVVAHDFEFRNWRPTTTETIEDDGTGRSHTIFLYQR
ncbi:SAM-dependent methyltransferase [Nevskia soli]|jgi:precorrin-6B methylase 2|uniref:SAM-dependent methyltransferase n=1 Tax=Nevskia soli TaxID=418856 RepID=UPI0015D85706|nr:methyltransferase domain-containing protein [Nevskia soli]